MSSIIKFNNNPNKKPPASRNDAIKSGSEQYFSTDPYKEKGHIGLRKASDIYYEIFL